jgi:uncharacterized membrane protein YfcA
MDLSEVGLLLAAGLAAGGVNAVAGGGSLVTFPTLVAVGLPPVAANVTNSIAVSPGYLAAVAGSRADLPGQRGRLLRLLPTAAAGSAAGCALLLVTPARAFELVVPFLVLAASASLALRDRLHGLIASGDKDNSTPGHKDNSAHDYKDSSTRGHKDNSKNDKGEARDHDKNHDRDDSAGGARLHVMVGLCALYGGYFGAALGVMLVAVLSVVLGETLPRVSAIKNVISAVVGLVTVAAFAAFGPVHWTAVAVVAPAALVGGYAGARLARRLPPRLWRAGIVTFGVAIGLLLLVRAAA